MANYNDMLVDWLLNTPAPDLMQWFQLNPDNYSPEELSVLKDRLVERWMMATGQAPTPLDGTGRVIRPLPVDPKIHQGTNWDNINSPFRRIGWEGEPVEDPHNMTDDDYRHWLGQAHGAHVDSRGSSASEIPVDERTAEDWLDIENFLNFWGTPDGRWELEDRQLQRHRENLD